MSRPNDMEGVKKHGFESLSSKYLKTRLAKIEDEEGPIGIDLKVGEVESVPATPLVAPVCKLSKFQLLTLLSLCSLALQVCGMKMVT